MNVSSTDIALKCTCQKENITDVFARNFFFFLTVIFNIISVRHAITSVMPLHVCWKAFFEKLWQETLGRDDKLCGCEY